MTMRATSAIAIGAFFVFAIAGCLPRVPGNTITTFIPFDDFLVSVNTSAAGMKSAETTLQKQQILAAIPGVVGPLLKTNLLEVVLTIQDVKMQSSRKARLKVTGLQTPELGKQPVRVFSLNIVPTIDLPLSQEVASTIKPGQRIRLCGVAGYHPGDAVKTILPRLNAFARIHFTDAGEVQQGAVITLVPTYYAIMKE